MKEKTIKRLSIIVLGGLLATGTAIMLGNTAQAFRGDYTKVGPYHNEERHKEMEEVMKNKDYEGWKKLMTENGRKPRILDKIDTKEKFDKLAQAYELMKEGKNRLEEANKIRLELGLGKGHKNEKNKTKENKRNFMDVNKDGVCDRR